MGKRNTELDILAAVKNHGAMGYFNGGHSDASKRLIGWYPEDSLRFDGRLSVFVDSLVNSGHLLPVNDTNGVRQPAYARGLTPKGEQRLYQMEHPVRAWLKVNWFPFVVACVTTCVGVASVVASFVPKSLLRQLRCRC